MYPPGPLVDATPRRVEINRRARGPAREQFRDLVVATGYLAGEGGNVLIRPDLGVAVTRLANAGLPSPSFEVIDFPATGSSSRGWTCVLHFFFHETGTYEFLRYIEGDWEHKLLRWGFEEPDHPGVERIERRAVGLETTPSASSGSGAVFSGASTRSPGGDG